MSSVLSFLEQCGVDSDFFGAHREEVTARLKSAYLAPAIREALEECQTKRLAALMGARVEMVCAVAPGRDDEDQEREVPQRDDDEEIAAAMVRRVA